MNEGMSYAILMGNLLTPWFNEWGHQVPLGRVKPKKKAETKAAAASAGKGGAALMANKQTNAPQESAVKTTGRSPSWFWL